MHRVYDFRDGLSRLDPVLLPELEAALASHCAGGEVLEAIVGDVGPDSFTLRSERQGLSTWPFPYPLTELRRGRRCLLVLGREEEVVGLGESQALQYVTLPRVVAIWVESPGAPSTART